MQQSNELQLNILAYQDLVNKKNLEIDHLKQKLYRMQVLAKTQQAYGADKNSWRGLSGGQNEMKADRWQTDSAQYFDNEDFESLHYERKKILFEGSEKAIK